MSMYTDDAHKKILSVELAVLGLRCWLEITSSLNLTMAIVQKQMIGQFVTNQGLRFHSGFGIVYVPQDKLRRSFSSVSDAEAGVLSLRDYHSLLGLLQSLIFVVGLRRSATFGLWEPLAGDAHPEHFLVPSPAIRQRLAEWRSRLSECAGASFEAGVERFAEEGNAQLPCSARLAFVFRSDASKEGARMPGLGGCLGGQGWRYPDATQLAQAFDDGTASLEHLDRPEEGKEVGVPLADLGGEEKPVAEDQVGDVAKAGRVVAETADGF